jgi:Uma2 family endonuclease
MSVTTRLHRYTYADYVAVELVSPGKHEFFDGQIYAMAGGTEDHSALSVAVTAALFAATRGGPCRVHSSDLRIYVEAVGLATYPDGSVICGPLEQHAASPRATALNPTVLVEVTSDSSEEYDTGFKLEAYQTVPSLRDYVIVSHRERRITVYRREGDGWLMRVAVSGGRVAVESIGAELEVDGIYAASTIAGPSGPL